MIPTRTVKTMRTHQHVRTMRSALSSVRPTRDQWQRLRETEQIQHAVGRLAHTKQGR